MSGLASKWATDDELVNKAKTQDKVPSKSTASENKWSTPATNNKPKPLVSKWASDSNDTAKSNKAPADRARHNRNEHDGPRHGRNERRNRNAGEKPFKRSHESLPTPPSTGDREERVSDASKSLSSRLGSGSTPKGPRGDGSSSRPQRRRPSRNSGERTNGRRGIKEDGDDNEETPVLSKAGQSLAARLGAPAIGNKQTKNDKDFESTDEEVTDDDEHSHKNEPYNETNEELPAMSSAGQSLASRLGMVSLGNSKPQSKDNDKKPTKQVQHPKGAYMTPKQKREEMVKKQAAEKERLQKEKDAQLKEEVKDMFSKLTSSTANWADLEDD